jgi:hypothetical protein
MARPWREYGPGDWLRLRPLLHRWKNWNHDRVNARYVALGADAPDLNAAAARLAGTNLAIAIAYNVPAMIAWQIRFMRRNLPNIAYAVIDNSSDARAAAAIREICAAQEIVYLRTPANPYSGAAASRSHGLALNWAWRNLVRRVEPPVFAFIDHDMMPVAPFDLGAQVAARPFYGRLARRGERWYLWAGFCAFDYARVAGLPLDFRQDWFNGLDTGGANWSVLYRRFDLPQLLATGAFASVTVEPVEPADPSVGSLERIADAWLHIGNASGWAPIEPGRPARVDALLARQLGGDAAEPPPFIPPS